MDYVDTRRQPLPMLSTAGPDQGEDRGPDRRTFLSETARLAAIAVLVSACGGGLGSLTGPTGYTLSQAVTVKLSDYPGLATAGSAVRVSGTNVPIALVNEGNGTYAALSLICTHQGATVQWNGQIFICPSHGAEFAADGHWIGGQPTSSLVSYPTSYDAATDTVTISPRG
jgi:cytochrome b6-f complex iron-sulfur subunit